MSDETQTAKKTIQIKNRWTQATLFECEADTIKAAVERAVLRRADLNDADLNGADLNDADLNGAVLRRADLNGADLSGAHLEGAYLEGADLSGACLSGAHLEGAYLEGAYLEGADMRGADLIWAGLSGAYLGVANLEGAKIGWTSHVLIAELLFRAAGRDIERRKFAGLVLISLDWCWDEFLCMTSDPQLEIALDELAKWVTKGDDAPKVLVDRAAKIKAETPVEATSVEAPASDG